MRKIKSGIYGLNPLLDGGVNENSTTVVIGRSGAGKTTIATQFIRRGLQDGQEGVFVSLDENKEQIIREAVEMGWSDILDYLDDELLVFIDASGREFSNFIRKELPAFVADWKGSNARIAIDPLTPVLWSTKDLYEQRDLIGFMFKETRKVGTVLCTLEEHGATDLTGPETVIPMCGDAHAQAALLEAERLARAGYRVLASASGPVSAYAAETPHVTRSVGVALSAAIKAINTGDFKTAADKLTEAGSGSDLTDYDKLKINQVKGFLALKQQDYNTAATAFEALIVSPAFGDLPPEEQTTTLHNARILSAQEKHWPNVITIAQKIEKTTPLDYKSDSVVAQAYYLTNDFPNAKIYAEKGIAAATAASGVTALRRRWRARSSGSWTRAASRECSCRSSAAEACE